MNYQDKVYGQIEINEPVILDLMKGPSLERIKGVDQHGYFEPYFPGTAFSRFEHSVGVLVLLKKFGAPLEEQIAGLIHDVSHTIFSHVGDYVYGSEANHNFQDNCHQKFVEKSEIPEILNKYGFDYKYILDEKNFPLKEQKLPDLCADRIDYFLRDVKATNKVNSDVIHQFLSGLVIFNKYWVFKNKSLAKQYALLYLEMNNWFWSGLESAVMFKTTGELLKFAISKKIITRDDLFTTEEKVWRKIRAAAKTDTDLNNLVERADNKFEYMASSKDDYDLYSQVKSRVVDPLILVKGSLKRLSESEPEFLELKHKYSEPKEYYIKFLERRDKFEK